LWRRCCTRRDEGTGFADTVNLVVVVVVVVVAVARNSALEVTRDTDIMMAAEAAAKLVPDLW